VSTIEEGRDRLNSTISDGSALGKFNMMMIAQGVRPELANRLVSEGANLFDILDKAQYQTEVKATSSGTDLFTFEVRELCFHNSVIQLNIDSSSADSSSTWYSRIHCLARYYVFCLFALISLLGAILTSQNHTKCELNSHFR